MRGGRQATRVGGNTGTWAWCVAGDANAPATQPAKKKIDKGPPIEPTLVKQFVGAGHADLNAVKQMLAERPSIVNGIWDWGGGDFETALGGNRLRVSTRCHHVRQDLFGLRRGQRTVDLHLRQLGEV